MAFPILFPLPSLPSSSSRVGHYQSPPPVGIKLTEKKRWSVKRVILLLLTAVAGYDFCNEFSLGAGSKGAAVRITPTNKRDGAATSWRERSLNLLRLNSTRKAPPLPPTTASAATTTTANTAPATTPATAGIASISSSGTGSIIARPTPSRPAPSPVTVPSVALLPSSRRSSISNSGSNTASGGGSSGSSGSMYRTLTQGSVGPQQQQQLYSNDNRAEWDEAEERELSTSALTRDTTNSTATTQSQSHYPYLPTGLSSPFIQSARPWQSPSGFTQLVEA